MSRIQIALKLCSTSILFFFLLPYSDSIHSQQTLPGAFPQGPDQSAKEHLIFQQASSLHSVATWDEWVNGNFSAFQADWVKQEEAAVTAYISQYYPNLAIANTTYSQSVLATVAAWEQQAYDNWQVQADTQILSERGAFIAGLNGQNQANLASSQSANNLNTDIQKLNSQYDQTKMTGLAQYNSALNSLDATFEKEYQQIAQTDAQYQAIVSQIQAYQNQVYSNLSQNVDGLKAYLFQQNLLHVHSATGTDLLGDYSSATQAQLVTDYTSLDPSKLTQAGQDLKTLIDNLQTAITNKSPLSSISQTMTNYLNSQVASATTQLQTYQAEMFQTITFGENSGNTKVEFSPATDFAGLTPGSNAAYSNALAEAAKQYIDSGYTLSSPLISQLQSVIGGSNLVVTQIYGMDIQSSSSTPYLLLNTPWNADLQHPITGANRSYLTGGENFYTFNQLTWLCWITCVPVNTTIDDQSAYLTGSVKVEDTNAAANAAQYQAYVDQLTSKFQLWNGTLLPETQNFDSQVSTFQSSFSAWTAQKAQLETSLNSQYQVQKNQLDTSLSTFDSNLAAMKSNSLQDSSSLPTFQTSVTSSSIQTSLSSIDNQIKTVSAQNPSVPDFSLVSSLQNNLSQGINAAYNLSVIGINQQISISNTQKSQEDIVNQLSSQRIFKSGADIPENIYEMFTGTSKDGKMSVKGGGQCQGAGLSSDACQALYKNNDYFQNQFQNVYTDSTGAIHVVENVHTGTATYTGKGDRADSSSYTQDMESKDYIVARTGVAKLGDTSSLGGLFDKNWLSESDSSGNSEVGSVLNSTTKNATSGIESSSLFNAISLNTSQISTVDSSLANEAQNFIQNQVSTASTVESLAQAYVQGVSPGQWAANQIKSMTQSAVASTIGTALNIPADLVNAYLSYKEGRKAQRKAEAAMNNRLAIVDAPLAIANMIPGVRDIARPFSSIVEKATSEVITGATNFFTKSDIGRAQLKILSAGTITDSDLKNLNKKGMKAAEYIRGKDLQGALSAGDIQGQYKAAFKNAAYLAAAQTLSPNLNNMDPKILAQLLQHYDNQQQQKAAKKAQQNQMISTALQMAAAAALQFIPGPGTIAGAGILAQIGEGIAAASEFMSSLPVVSDVVEGVSAVGEYLGQGIRAAKSFVGLGESAVGTATTLTRAESGLMNGVRIINAAGQVAIASQSGNTNSMLAGLANGLLLGVAGPGGLTGSISYTAPPKDNTLLGGSLDNAIDGTPSSGWGGSIAFGGSALNAGISFQPGSGANLNLGGSKGSTFLNVSYNTESGNTSGSVGAGAYHGTNLGVNLSTDPNQKPSIFAGLNCDASASDCGGGRLAKNGGATLTISQDGSATLGANFLGSQFGSISFDSTGKFGTFTADPSFQTNFNIVNAQNVYNEYEAVGASHEAAKYALALSDPKIAEASPTFKALIERTGISQEDISQLGKDLQNNRLSPEQRDAGTQLLNQLMNAVNEEAYSQGNPKLLKAISTSPLVQEAGSMPSDSGSFIRDVSSQASLLFKDLAGSTGLPQVIEGLSNSQISKTEDPKSGTSASDRTAWPQNSDEQAAKNWFDAGYAATKKEDDGVLLADASSPNKSNSPFGDGTAWDGKIVSGGTSFEEGVGGDNGKGKNSNDEKYPNQRAIVHTHDYSEGTRVGSGKLNIREGVSNPFGDPTSKDIKLSAAWGKGGYPQSGKDHTGADFIGPTGSKINAAISGIVVNITKGTSIIDETGRPRGVFSEKADNGEKVYYKFTSDGSTRLLNDKELKILANQPKSNSGNSVTIRTTVGGNTYDLTYKHLQNSPTLKSGQPIKAGSSIGIVGSTGYSTGEHLHLMVTTDSYPFDVPKDYVRVKDGKYQIDPVYFLNHVYNN
ncbi:peptidase, M23 family [Leptospira phage vB_LbrZ_5399-LE1]|uniref:TIGR04388 family protein n=1 Tax=Leptospira inadai serovar Lyme TaxID=293084 RepID=A0ABX4YGC8_9LEPT|nr:TIGR04388 family protein [Leptospira inadai]AGS80716.1 peptidase, M23 family [Leptospira phage vB_LbrZ_5399-LE1]AGS80882.1 peptidase, M23 family [Leptospira phage vB_LinZ_10-LE1]PNV74321.1 TIGR04388 family protein [Leptospira inadai serovar Lyme]